MKWLRRAGIAVGVLLGIGLLTAGVGALLPVEHTASVSAVVRGSPEEVWAVITDVEGLSAWRPDVDSVRPAEEGTAREGWTEYTSTAPLAMDVPVWDPPGRLVTRIADEGLPFGGSWTYELSPEGDGTRVMLTEDGEIYNPLFRAMSRFVFGYDATMRRYLDALESRMESAPARGGAP